jgi:hypothetical protein
MTDRKLLFEIMFSMAYLFQFYGINQYADKAELAAFNAFPAALTPDCKSCSSCSAIAKVLNVIRVDTPIESQSRLSGSNY